MSKAESVEEVTLVKVEEGSESINEIQTYLESFNKEIEGGSEAAREGNTYYVDANGQYYYTQPVMCVTSAGDGGEVVSTDTSPTPNVIPVPTPPPSAVTQTTSTRQAVALTGESATSVLMNAGDGAFGTVTLMPQDGAGDVSYVLFVQAPPGSKQEDESEHLLEEEVEDEQNLGVYDFNEEGGQIEQVGNESEMEEDTKPKIVKLKVKNQQSIQSSHMCNYCNYTSPKRYLLSRHMKSHSEERPHKCSVCERGFKTLASLQNHVNTHTGTKPHHCRFCASSFTTSGELVRHVRYKHTHEKPHRCSDCDYASVELSKLKRHVRCHTGERPYQCPHCTYASPDTFKLKRHLRIHTGEKPYECEVCHARFTQSNSLKAHRLIHSVADKPVFRCELCPATCGRKTDLRIHVQKLHTSDRLLKCKRCGKTFPDRYTYKVHSKTHEGEKCYRCDLCLYASVSARHLESHMLIHTDQKPFQCEMCDQAFRQKQLLKRHQNLYHTPNYVPPAPKEKTHECPECGRSFRHRGNLIRHLAVHDPDSAAHEKALALKIGRQKKVQYVDGQQVELITEDDVLSDGNGMVVGDGTGQQYVVLEVIHIQDDNVAELMSGEEGGSIVTSGVNLSEAALEDHSMENDPLDQAEKQLIKVERRADKVEGMDDCFGFGDEDDEEDEEGEDEEIMDVKNDVIVGDE